MVRGTRNILNTNLFLLLAILSLSFGESFAQNIKKTFSCKGTYYHNRFENKRTASGELFSQKLYTAAHKSLPLHTVVKVTNSRTNSSILVKINDRCGRRGIIDLTKIAANKIGLKGSEQVIIEVLGKDYVDIWNQQNVILNDKLMNDSVSYIYIDSLITERKQCPHYLYYVRITTISEKCKIESVKKILPQKYVDMLHIEKIYNEKFFYVNIGPFPDKKTVDTAVSELKKLYPSVHSIKKKRE